jgi:3-hydroxybutyrate dehydrogenase
VVRKVVLGEQPTKRFVAVLEIAGAVAFLCSERARSTTGSTPPVNGGWLAH